MDGVLDLITLVDITGGVYEGFITSINKVRGAFNSLQPVLHSFSTEP